MGWPKAAGGSIAGLGSPQWRWDRPAQQQTNRSTTKTESSNWTALV